MLLNILLNNYFYVMPIRWAFTAPSEIIWYITDLLKLTLTFQYSSNLAIESIHTFYYLPNISFSIEWENTMFHLYVLSLNFIHHNFFYSQIQNYHQLSHIYFVAIWNFSSNVMTKYIIDPMGKSTFNILKI